MEADNRSQELDIMKQQLEILRTRLDSQKIVSDKHIRKAIRAGVSELNRRGRRVMALGIFAMLTSALTFYRMGMSLWFCGATELMLAFCIFKTWRQHMALWDVDMSGESLVSVGKKVRELKQDYVRWLRVGIPMVLLWLAWFVVECLADGMDDASVALVAGGCVGGAFGLVIGLRMHHDTVRKADSILEQIEDSGDKE